MPDVCEKKLRLKQYGDVLAMSQDGLGREDISVTLSIEVEDVRLMQKRLVGCGLLPEHFGGRDG